MNKDVKLLTEAYEQILKENMPPVGGPNDGADPDALPSVGAEDMVEAIKNYALRLDGTIDRNGFWDANETFMAKLQIVEMELQELCEIIEQQMTNARKDPRPNPPKV